MIIIMHNDYVIQILTNWKLIIIVLAITGFTTLLLIVGEAVPFLRGTAKRVNDPESREGRNVSLQQLLNI